MTGALWRLAHTPMREMGWPGLVLAVLLAGGTLAVALLVTRRHGDR